MAARDREVSSFLAGKTALVTDAGCEVGRAVATRLAAAGASVIISAKGMRKAPVCADFLAETASLIESAGGTVVALRSDLDAPQEAERLVARAVEVAGPFQILVHVAGLSRFRAVESNYVHGYGLTVDHYFRVPLVLTAAAKPVMRDCGGGSIVNVGPAVICGVDKSGDSLRETRELAVLCAARLALLRLTKSMASELEDDNIGAYLALPCMPIYSKNAQLLNDTDLQSDLIESLAETVVELCRRPAQRRTAIVEYARGTV